MPRERSDDDMVTRLANRAEDAIRDIEALSLELEAARARIRVLEDELDCLRSDTERNAAPVRGNQ